MINKINTSKEGIKEYIGKEGKEIGGIIYKNCKIVEFEGNEYIVSNNAIFTIQLTDICNANCNFCFNGITFYPNGTAKNLEKIEKAISFCKTSGIESVAISGGEPTLNIKSLINLVEKIKGSFKDYRIHSNGFNLFKNIDNTGEKLIDYLAKNGINKITLSLAHYNYNKNSELMKFRGNFKGIEKNNLKYLGEIGNKVSTRLSCFLNKNGIFTIEDIIKYIDFGKKFGIKNFIFRSGGETDINFLKDTDYVNFGNQNKTDIGKLANELINLGYTKKFSLHKSDINVYVLEKDNITVDLEESSEEIDPDKKIRRVNYFGNGITYSSWIDPSSTIFNSDKEEIINECINNTKISKGGLFPASDLGFSLNSRIKSIIDNKIQFPIDLHIHTINSDGKTSSKEVLDEAKKFNVKIMTITEHNFISEKDYNFIKEYSKKIGIVIPFPGVEISVVSNKNGTPYKKHHLLGYGEGLLDPEFQKIISLPNKIKNQYYSDLIERIEKKLSINLPSFDEMLKGINEKGLYETPNKGLITRSIIAKYIKNETGLDIEYIKNEYLPLIPEEISYSKFNNIEDIIPLIKELGGVSGLAHPGWNRPFNGKGSNINLNYKDILEEIWNLKKIGMNGFEIYHKSHSKETKEIFQKFAKELMLINLGGSDYHAKKITNPNFTEINPGTFGLTYEEYKKIKNLIK